MSAATLFTRRRTMFSERSSQQHQTTAGVIHKSQTDWPTDRRTDWLTGETCAMNKLRHGSPVCRCTVYATTYQCVDVQCTPPRTSVWMYSVRNHVPVCRCTVYTTTYQCSCSCRERGEAPLVYERHHCPSASTHTHTHRPATVHSPLIAATTTTTGPAWY